MPATLNSSDPLYDRIGGKAAVKAAVALVCKDYGGFPGSCVWGLAAQQRDLLEIMERQAEPIG